MNQLDDEQNWNLFYLVLFLNNYHLSNNLQFRRTYQSLMDSYGKIVQKINVEDCKTKVSNSSKIFLPERLEELPSHVQMINNFKALRKYEQNNVMALAWFILYCKKYKLDHPELHYVWKRYSQLIMQIKSLNFCRNI